MPLLFALYLVASLVHHAHNALNLSAYPNMPHWLSPAEVMVVWSVETLIGIAGYALFKHGRRPAGLSLIAAYAFIGFAGLDHYAIAPMASHTSMMNATIWSEVASAALLLAAVIATAFSFSSRTSSGRA